MPRRSRLLLLLALALTLVGCADDDSTTAGSDAECEEGVVETDSGLEYENLECGSGEAAGRGDVVTVEYAVALEGDDPFDSGTLPPFELGTGSVVPGFDEGVVGMRVGGARELVVSPELGYGAEGRPPQIPPDSTLVFEVKLLELRAD